MSLCLKKFTDRIRAKIQSSGPSAFSFPLCIIALRTVETRSPFGLPSSCLFYLCLRLPSLAHVVCLFPSFLTEASFCIFFSQHPIHQVPKNNVKMLSPLSLSSPLLLNCCVCVCVLTVSILTDQNGELVEFYLS